MEHISFTVKIIEQSIKIADELRTRREMMKRNPELCVELGDLLGEIKTNLERVKPERLPRLSEDF